MAAVVVKGFLFSLSLYLCVEAIKSRQMGPAGLLAYQIETARKKQYKQFLV